MIPQFRKVLVLMLLMSSALYAQDSDEDVRLLTPPHVRVRAGEVVEIRIAVENRNPGEPVLLLPDNEPGLALVEQPAFLRRGFSGTEARIRLRPSQAGRYVLDGLGVRVGGETSSVESVLIEATDSQGRVPFSLRWRPLVESAWVGQSIPIVLEMTRIDEFAYPEEVDIRSPQQGLFEEVSGLGSVQSTMYGDVELFSVPVAGFLITPAQVGEVEVPSAEVTALGHTVRSGPAQIATQTIPEAIAASAAIGRFTMEVDVPPSRLEEGGRVVMTIRGEGNLPVLAFPDIDVVGFQIVEETETSAIGVDTESLLGYQGERVLSVRIDPDGTSAVSRITIEPFVYLDPVAGRVVELDGRVVEIETPVEAAPDLSAVVPDLELIELEQLGRLRWYPLQSMRFLFWLLLLPPGALAIALIIRATNAGKNVGRLGAALLVVPTLLAFSIYPELDIERLSRAADLARGDRPGVAGVLYSFELERHPENAALHYNRGVLALRAQDAPRAVAHFRRAVRIVPESERFRDALAQTYLYFGLRDEFPIAGFLRPLWIFLGLFALWTVFFLTLYRRGGARRVIVLLSLIIFQLVALGGLIWSLRVSGTPEATLVQEATIRRIPDLEASPWVQLETATVVMVELAYEEFYLIRTGSGVTGWIPVSAVEYSQEERL